MQPPTGTSSESLALKQPTSSESFFFSLRPGWTHLPRTALSQYSKWPISSEKATLYECAAHGTRVCSLEVAYIGWNAYAVWLQVAAVGSKFTWAKPFATLAVIDPDCPDVASLIATTNPFAESWIDR